LVKHASRIEAAHLASAGYRFAELNNVFGTISRALQVDKHDVENQLGRMRGYHGPQHAFKPGVHIGFFGMRPNVQKGFNVVVREDSTHVIPSVQLPIKSVDAAQLAKQEFIMQYMGKGVNTILKELRAPATSIDLDIEPFRYSISWIF
jgi:hypothetical protein